MIFIIISWYDDSIPVIFSSDFFRISFASCEKDVRKEKRQIIKTNFFIVIL
jgi:hypothetical protein